MKQNELGVEDGKLAALTRDILGAKGLVEIAKGLLDALTPERRAQLAEELVMQRATYEIAGEISKLLIDGMTEETKNDIKVLVAAEIEKKKPDIVKRIAEQVGDARTGAARHGKP